MVAGPGGGGSGMGGPSYWHAVKATHSRLAAATGLTRTAGWDRQDAVARFAFSFMSFLGLAKAVFVVVWTPQPVHLPAIILSLHSHVHCIGVPAFGGPAF